MLKKLLKMMKDAKGFTLVELLAVIVILGIIAAIAVPAIGGLITNTEGDADDANATVFEEAARLANAAGDLGTVTVGGTEIDGITLTSLESNGYIESIPLDPTTDTAYSGDNYVQYDSTDNTYTFNKTDIDS